jgi:hypothetical protein
VLLFKSTYVNFGFIMDNSPDALDAFLGRI